MKATAWITSAVFVLVCAILQAQPPAGAGVLPGRQISQIETDAIKASLRNDVAFFENLMADDYFGIDPAGNVVSKSKAIADRKSGALQWRDIKASEERVEVFGDIAIATGLWTTKGTLAGHDIGGAVRYTRIYRNVNGTWKLNHNQLTSVAP